MSKGSYRDAHEKYRIQLNGINNLILFQNKIGFINPKYQDKFTKFIYYSKDYDENILGISPKRIRDISIEKNKLFLNNMAQGRFELPTSAFLN